MLRDSSYYLPAALVCALLFIISFQPQSRAQSIAPVGGVEAAMWREDLRFMAQEMPKRHKNLFHAMRPEQFAAAVKRLDERIPTLARHQIIVELARIVAQVGITNDGHTSLPLVPPPHEGAPFKIGFRQYPLKLYLYSDGLFVQSAASEYAAVVGERVVKIGRVSPEQAFKAASELVSRDNEMTLKDRVPELLTIPEVLHALGLIENMEKARFTFESGGAETALDVSPVPDAWKARWVDAREAASPTPLWLKDPHNNYWFEYLTDSRTLYFQYNGASDKREGESLRDFFKKLFAFIEGHAVDRLVIDLRLNRGGNAVLSWPLIYGIIRSDKLNRKGKLFTIIGRSTFSAGSQTAAWLDLHTRATFVGEPTGGGVNVYGNHDSIVLPRSGIELFVAPYFFQNTYPWDERPWIAPHIMAQLSSDDYRRNHDPALNAILKYQPVAEILTKALTEGGAQLMVKRYLEFKTNPATASINTEEEVNALGYELLEQRRLSEAIEVFKLNVTSYPVSANAYDSLGDAYERNGDKGLAIKAYERALELNPSGSYTAAKLRRLRGQ